MAITAMMMNIDEEHVVAALQEAGQKIDPADGEAVIDMSSVRRVDSSMLRALDEFARVAEEKAVKIVLRGVNVDIYKVLKLAKLTQRFSFVSREERLKATE